MTQFTHCPTCGDSITNDKLCGQTIVCICGWTHSYASIKNERSRTQRVLATMTVMFAFFIASFIHAVNWDTHFFTVIPLKLKELSKTASKEDLRQIIDICTQRSKQACVEKAMHQIYLQDPSDLETLAELGHHQFQRAKVNESIKTLETYFSKGGKSFEAAQDYARALSQTGLYKEALHYFQYALKAQPKNFQVSLARDYILTLIKQKNYSQAKTAIEYYRKKSVSSAYFMDKEYRQILTELRFNRSIAKSS